ncbi:MAG: SAM-dependent methyltransferase, partial [Pseudomonadales bacterium]
RFITGHRRNGVLNLDWKHLVAAEETLVFYMSLNGLEEISEKLIENGMSADMPAAMVEKGTLSDQRVWTATIGSIAPIIRADNAKAPTLLIVGTVVDLHDKLGKPRVKLD